MLEVGNRKASRLCTNNNFEQFWKWEQGGPKETPVGMTGVSGQETERDEESELEHPKPFPQDSRGKLKYQWNQAREL